MSGAGVFLLLYVIVRVGASAHVSFTLFPGSELGLEAAAIFAVFTSQAWNITFSFYHSLVTQPGELDEPSRLMGLSRWKRFWSIDVPARASRGCGHRRARRFPAAAGHRRRAVGSRGDPAWPS